MLRDYGFKEIRNHIERSYKGERRMPRLPAARKKSLNRGCHGSSGVVGAAPRVSCRKRKRLERRPVQGERPVRVEGMSQGGHLSRAGHEESCLNLRGPSRKAKYDRKTDSEPVP